MQLRTSGHTTALSPAFGFHWESPGDVKGVCFEQDRIAAEVGGYTVADFTTGVRFDGPLDGLEAQLNLTNLTDEEYVSTIGTNGFNTSSDNQTLMVGAPRQIFVTIRKSF